MADPVDYIERTREQYASFGYPAYRWVTIDEAPPFTPLSKPLATSTVGLIASGGIYRRGQIAFHFKDDLSYRAIESDTKLSELRVTHFAYDMTDARKDVNVIFPLETLRDLARLSRIGKVADSVLTFMGGIYSARQVREVLAPALADRLVRDEVDVAIMVPA